MRPGDVYWVNFPPPSSRAQANRRPVVVLQDDRVAGRSPMSIVVPLTTTDLFTRLPGVVPIGAQPGNGLTFRSFALVNQTTAVDRAWFDGQAGVVDPAVLGAIFAALDQITGRPAPPPPPPVAVDEQEPPDPPRRRVRTRRPPDDEAAPPESV